MSRSDITAFAAVVGLALLSAVLWMTPASADNNVLCVQQQLVARGYDPGPLDGALGSRTLSAAQAAAQAARFSLQPLTGVTAGAWCQALGGQQTVTLGAVQAPAAAPAVQSLRGPGRYCIYPDPSLPGGCDYDQVDE